MKMIFDNNKPIYMQISQQIQDDILDGFVKEEEQVMSTTEFSKLYGINPATSRKGLNLLVEENILYKKRGLGMFVKLGAKEYIKNKRKDNFSREYIFHMLKEAKKIGISREKIIEIIKNYKEV